MPHSPFLQPLFRKARSRSAFTIIETVVILIIIALMLAIIVPHMLMGLKTNKAKRVKQDLVTLNSAIEHFALDNGKVGGVEVNYLELRKYLDPESDVFLRDGKNIYGDTYGPFYVGTRPSVPANTADKLSDVAGVEYWSPFPVTTVQRPGG